MRFFCNRAYRINALRPLVLSVGAGVFLLSLGRHSGAAPTMLPRGGASPKRAASPSQFKTFGAPVFRNLSRGPATPLSLDLQRLAARYGENAPESPVSSVPLPPSKGNTAEGKAAKGNTAKGNTNEELLSPAAVDSVLLGSFGLTSADRTTPIEVVIRLKAGANSRQAAANLRAAGATIRFSSGSVITAAIPIGKLNSVADVAGIASIDVVTRAMTPPQFAPEKVGSRGFSRGPVTKVGAFDAKGLTGKGVIVAVIDSGIDWRHDDFRRADGTSRVLALWDIFDNSWAKSKIGSAPPTRLPDGTPLGTLYTNAQINAALDGTGVVNSHDEGGHGTACAGAAAGNGRATGNGVAAGSIKGVAPDADLLVVKVSPPSDYKAISDIWLVGTQWAIQTAKALKRPIVVSQSFGNNSSAGDGTALDEVSLGELAGAGKPGVAICAAAGNQGRYSFHAAGRFGPNRPGQNDQESQDIDLVVNAPKTRVVAYFDAADDWGLSVMGQDTLFTDQDAKGHRRPALAQFFKKGAQIGGRLGFQSEDSRNENPDDFKWYFTNCLQYKKISAKTQALELILPKGRYVLAGFGTTTKVVNGRFDLLLPSPDEADFGRGTVKEVMVSSPGTASGVITVGAMDARGQWQNLTGQNTYVNLEVGRISDYSSPGFRRDGVVKPDIAAPASYTLSSLARNAKIARDEDGKPDTSMITRDGQHLAWMGTSAATPYVAGVVALMLQKNPSLDGAQIQRILQRTARHSLEITGAVPNPRWGYGAIDPAAALAAVPARTTTPRTATPRTATPAKRGAKRPL